jgi:transcriptional regulator with XRE-family HTH domain
VRKLDFGDLVHTARADKNLSLRRLASLSGVDYSRLARIEQGTRPAPDLTAIRSLADALDLDVGELMVAAGTSRSVMEDLVWSERTRLGRVTPALGAYRPVAPRLLARNSFDGVVLQREGALCSVRVGDVVLRVLSFSSAKTLRVVIPPETVIVSAEQPAADPGAAATVLEARVEKIRVTGQLVNLVLAGGGFSLNALRAAGRRDTLPARGDSVHVTLLTATIHTSPLEETA